MAEDTTTCPQCGTQSQDKDWCDECGADLRASAQAPVPWLEVGEAVHFELEGTQRVAQVVDILESYTSRRVLLARLFPQGEGPEAPSPNTEENSDATREYPQVNDDWPTLLLEESEEDHSLEPDALTDNVRHLVNLPIQSIERGGDRRVDIFEDPPGMPLQEFLENHGRLLNVAEVAALTELLMDAVELIHKDDLYHFQICPWTLHIGPSSHEDTDPLTLQRPLEDLALSFDNIRGFYRSSDPLESHPVIMNFSPPEFFGRSPGPLDHRADIFGVGMLFYYLLAGSPPPTGTLTRHRPYVPVRGYRFDLPPGLESFVEGCTSQNPVNRYKSIEEARAGLHQALMVHHARDLNTPLEEDDGISIFCAVDRHIGIGKGRRTPVNQDGVFLGHAPQAEFSLISVGDGVSTASFGSGDVASRLFVEASAIVWSELLHNPELLDESPADEDMPEVIAEDEVLNDTEENPSENEDTSDHSSDEEGPATREITEEEDEDDIPHIPVGRVNLVGQHSTPTNLETPAADLVRRVLELANESISEYINDRFAPFSGPVHEVMGTTALVGLFHKDTVTLASLGDSRIYLLRDGHMECLTRDHNLATMRILEGFSPDECLALPQGMALARCLGTFEVQEGYLNAVHPEPDLMTFRLLPGDTLLLTTDGLIDFAGPTEATAERNIQTILEQEEIPSLACLRLMLLANEGGGEDNIGLSVIRVTEKQHGQRPMLYQAFPPVPGMSPGE